MLCLAHTSIKETLNIIEFVSKVNFVARLKLDAKITHERSLSLQNVLEVRDTRRPRI